MSEKLIAAMDGQRLDQFLAQRITDLSRTHLKRLIKRGCVTVDGVVKRPDYHLKAGDRVQIDYPDAPASPGTLKEWTIFEDKHLLVINKPPGLLMHPLGTSWLDVPEAAISDPQPNLAGILISERRTATKAVTRLGIVHRLDRQTSGVLLIANTQQAYEALINAFKTRTVTKHYRAVVAGVLPQKKTIVDAPIGRIQGFRTMKVTPFGRESSTVFFVKEECGKACLVEARPLTGRTHQIRAHLAHLGHPVLGDPEFRSKGFEPLPPRLMLHAFELKVAHPFTGKPLKFKAPLPPDFKGYWAELKKLG